jgi:hypothetical protein
MISSSSAPGKPAAAVNSPPRLLDCGLLEISASAALFLLVFQNLPLTKTVFGGFGAAASMPFVLLSAVLLAVRSVASAPRQHLSAGWVLAGTYLLCVTIFGIVHFGFVFRGTSLITKAIMAGLQFAMFAVAFRVAWEVPREWIAALVAGALAVNLLGLVLIQGDTGSNTSVISFSSEPSHFGVLTGLLSLALLYFSKRGPLVWLLVSANLIAAFLSGSKGGIAGLALALGITFIVRKHGNLRFWTLWAPITLAVAITALVIVYQMLLTDLANFTSVATRGASIMTAGLISLEHPLGVGLGGFFPAFSTTVPRAWDILTTLTGSSVNLTELFQFAYADDRNLSAKSLFGDVLIYLGWPGFIALAAGFAVLYRRTLARSGYAAYALNAAVLFGFIASLTYYVGMPLYVLPMVMGLIWHEVRRA